MANRRHDTLRWLGWALLMEGAYLTLHAAQSPAQQIALVLGAYAVGGVWLGLFLWRMHRGTLRVPTRAGWACILAGAAVFRLTLLPLAGATSSDAARYRWEGLIQTAGFNPYVLAPNAPELAGMARMHAPLHRAVNHPSIASIYPPLPQLLFRANAALLGGSLMGWKFILLFFDVLLVASLWMILGRRNVAATGIIAVLWCPLLLIESYEGAHLDLIGIALLTAAVAAMDRGRWFVAAVSVGLSVNVKYLWPGLALVLLAARARRDGRRAVGFVAVALTVIGLGWLPYGHGAPNALATTAMFANQWSFNGTMMRMVRGVFEQDWMATVLVFAVLGGLTIYLCGGQTQNGWHDTWLIGGTALLLSPVAYPWYFLWIVPGLAFRPPLWLIAWVVSVGSLHLAGWWHYTWGEWHPMTWLGVLVTIAPAVGLAHAWRHRLMLRAGRPAPVRETAPPCGPAESATLLTFGARA